MGFALGVIGIVCIVMFLFSIPHMSSQQVGKAIISAIVVMIVLGLLVSFGAPLLILVIAFFVVRAIIKK
jgi:hypothetical protein